MKIESATEQDLDRLVEIDRECFPEYPYGPVVMRQLLEVCGGLFLKATADRASGFVIGAVEVDDPRTGWMLNLAVSSEFRSSGIGRALTRSLIDGQRKRGITRCLLAVEPDNLPALAIYESFGWKEIEVRSGYFDGQDRVMMQLDFLGFDPNS